METARQHPTPEILPRLEKSFNDYTKLEAIIRALGALALCFQQRVDLNPVTQALYLEVLEDLSPDQLKVAFTRAHREMSDFFPPPGKLRQLAGCPTAAQRSETAAREALQWLISVVRRHGPELRAVQGKICKTPYRDENGRMQPAEYEPHIQAPPIPERTIDALEKIVMGTWGNDTKAMMEWALSHPALPRNAEAYDNVTLRESAIQKFEARWLRAWVETEPKVVALAKSDVS